MLVKDLIKLLQQKDQDAVIDMSSDEEGNSYGDVDPAMAEGKLKDGRKVYSMYPQNSELPEDRYEISE